MEYDPPPKKPAFIFDIDGTVALADGKRGYHDYGKVDGDTPNWPVIVVIKALLAHYTWQPIAVSGRMDSEKTECRQKTELWIARYINLFKPEYPLFMRYDRDYRPDDVVKAEIYARDIEPYYDVMLVFDDRDRVVNMWRDKRLTCFQVAEGDF